MTDLRIAMANDVGSGQRVAAAAAAMTAGPGVAPKLKDLVAKAGGVIGEWGETLERTRELTAVLVVAGDGGKATLTDRGAAASNDNAPFWTYLFA